MLQKLLCGVGGWALVLVLPASAQRIDLDASVGASGSAWRAAVSSQWRRDFGARITLGTGLRVTHYGGEPANHGNQSTITGGLPDSLAIDPAVWGINLMVSAQARLGRSLSAGANIDLVGVASGPSQVVGGATVEVVGGSLFQYGNNDRGSLNSEFFVAVQTGSRLEVRGGLSHYVVGFTATDGASSARYLRFETVPFVGLRWR